jgi:hypothetical protein
MTLPGHKAVAGVVCAGRALWGDGEPLAYVRG